MPPGRIWPGAAFAPPRAFVVPGPSAWPLDSHRTADRGRGAPKAADSAIVARDLCVSSLGYVSLRCHCNRWVFSQMAKFSQHAA